jgi:two-component system sensor histidine kinase DegS
MPDPATRATAIIIQAEEEERYRLAKILQQGPAQLLANATLEIETCLRLMHTQPQVAQAGLQQLRLELEAGLISLRNIIAGLQPPLLKEMGLVVALEKCIQQIAEQANVTITMHGWERLNERLPAIVELAIFRILQEALENVRDHSRATSAQVTLEQIGEQFQITIADNGRGFAANTNAGRRLGLVAMRDRAALLGGDLHVFSEPGRGVRVVLSMPWRATMPWHDGGKDES